MTDKKQVIERVEQLKKQGRVAVTLYPLKEKYAAVFGKAKALGVNMTTDAIDMMCDVFLSHGDINYKEPNDE